MFYNQYGKTGASLLVLGLSLIWGSSVFAQEKLMLLDAPAKSAPAVPEVKTPAPAPQPKTAATGNIELSLDDELGNDELGFSLDGDDELAPARPAPAAKPLPAPENKASAPAAPLPAPANALPKENTSGSDNLIKAYNNFVDENDRREFENKNNGDDSLKFGDKIMNQVKEDLFSQMADIEKQTSLLTLELKREKIKNEIEAMKAARLKAEQEALAQQEAKERQQREWEKEQERKLMQEEQRLKELEIQYEQLRQEKVLKAYKESLLKSNQEWVDYNSRMYNQLVKEEKQQDELIKKQKEYFADLNAAVNRAASAAQKMKEQYTKEVANLQTQVAVLKTKLEAEKVAFEESKKVGPNPFALVDDDNAPKKKLSEEYAIMEISGKGEHLVAKLINRSGGSFMVKRGTILNTGHVVEDITQTYISADKSGVKDYLYFSAGGILEKEPEKGIAASGKAGENGVKQPGDSGLTISKKVPSLREGMFVK